MSDPQLDTLHIMLLKWVVVSLPDNEEWDLYAIDSDRAFRFATVRDEELASKLVRNHNKEVGK